MKLIREETEFGTNVYLKEDDKYLTMAYCGNLDLYWSIHAESDYTFTITKENYKLYHLFEQLFYDVINSDIYGTSYAPYKNVFYDEEIEPYRHGNDLYDKKTNTITWYSDETASEVSNILKIRKVEDAFELEFYTQPYIRGYSRDFSTNTYIPIRFRNSGSKYEPYNIIFMRMYSELIKLDDVKEDGHQIHMEEYLYRQNKVKTLGRY